MAAFHHAIDEVVDDGCDSVDPAEAIIEGGRVGSGIHCRLPPLRVKGRIIAQRGRRESGLLL